jgi:hypothetical protein
MNVISASRRTDLPAWYGDWFMNRIRAGFAVYRNPFGGQEHRVSLGQAEVIAFVFWTRNPLPFLPHLERLLSLGYRACFQFTVTGYGSPLEAGVPPWPRAVKSFESVARLLGPRHVRWRYDPILVGGGFTPDFHRKNFSHLASRLEGLTEACHISFVQFYRKTRRNLDELEERSGIRIADPEETVKTELAVELRSIAASRGIRLLSCCTPVLDRAGVEQGACVDAGWIRALRPDLPDLRLKIRPSRKGCLCAESRDIGAYDTCLGGCVYCYANQHPLAARRRFAEQDPDSERLG